MNPLSLRRSEINAEPPMQVSKWLQVQVLLDAEEMGDLLDELGDFGIYLAGTLTRVGEGMISKADFLQAYSVYSEALKKGQIPEESFYRPLFSSVFSASPELLYVVPIAEEKQLIRLVRPVIQLQSHSIGYSVHDGKFRPMVFGLDTILWGLQFSYPQLYLEVRTKEVMQVTESDFFPNTRLFHALQKWIRRHTIPTPFLVGESKINVPMRLGKKCLPWINNHPQLVLKNLKVHTA